MSTILRKARNELWSPSGFTKLASSASSVTFQNFSNCSLCDSYSFIKSYLSFQPGKSFQIDAHKKALLANQSRFWEINQSEADCEASIWKPTWLNTAERISCIDYTIFKTVEWLISWFSRTRKAFWIPMRQWKFCETIHHCVNAFYEVHQRVFSDYPGIWGFSTPWNRS